MRGVVRYVSSPLPEPACNPLRSRQSTQVNNHRCIVRTANEERTDSGAGFVIERILQIASERASGKQLWFVRGPMGCGMTTLHKAVVAKMDGARRAAPTIKGAIEIDAETNRGEKVALIDAGDHGRPEDCSRRIDEAMADYSCVFVFGREEFLRSVGKAVHGFLDLEPLSPDSGDLHGWIDHMAEKHKLDPSQSDRLKKHYRQLVNDSREYQWVGWLDLIAGLVKLNTDRSWREPLTPLDVFYNAIGQSAEPAVVGQSVSVVDRMAQQLIDDKLCIRMNRRESGFEFMHLQLVRAKLVLEGGGSESSCLKLLAKADRPFEAISLLCNHLSIRATHELETNELSVVWQMCEFLKVDMLDRAEADQYVSGHGLWAQGLVAKGLRDLSNRSAIRRRDVRNQLLPAIDDALTLFGDRIERFRTNGRDGPRTMPVAQLWDLSDAMHVIRHPILDRDGRSREDRFKEVSITGVVEIGTRFPEAMNLDLNKPLSPYERTSVVIPKVWVGKYLVTVREYREFHEACSGPSGEEFFEGAGLRWFKRDPALLKMIARDFDCTKERSLFCERAIGGEEPKAVRNYEQWMKRRACRQREDDHSDRVWKREEHHKHDRLPVVDVNWWEAVAYCRWFTKRKLRAAGFPPERYEARLMPDWLWEAVRRVTYATTCQGDAVSATLLPELGAHIKRKHEAPGRVGHLCFPVHVGVFVPPDSPDGPYDMAGNVWEWTSSASLARIREAGWITRLWRALPWSAWRKSARPDAAFETEWTEPAEERRAQHPYRERENSALQMRVLRGGSFMSTKDYALNACLRMCDPPYYSFQDVGFRIAVFSRLC